MRIAFLVVDDRFDRPLPRPFFGTAPQGLLAGFAGLDAPGNETSGPNSSRLEIHVICCVKEPIAAPEKLASNIWYHQIVLPHWSFLRSGHLGPLLGVRKLLRKLNPDVVHAQGTERWCAISAAFAPYPKVLTIHGNLRLINRVAPMEPRMYWKAQEFLETLSIPRFNGVVCITGYTQQNVSDLAKSTWVIPNAVDESFFPLGAARLQTAASKDISPQAEPPAILVVAHIQPRKNQNRFIDAIAPLASRYGFRVRFFGRISPEPEFAAGFQERLEKYSWCTYEGMLGRDELREAFRSASLLVLPSLEDNCPMSVLEAMAAGVPVVAAKVGGVPDLVSHEVNGLFCDPLSEESMRDAIDRVFRDSIFAQKLVEAGYQTAQDRFHPLVIARQHLKVYKEVIAREGRKPSC